MRCSINRRAAPERLSLTIRSQSASGSARSIRTRGKAAAQQRQDAGPRSITCRCEQKTFYTVSDEVLDVFAFPAAELPRCCKGEPCSRPYEPRFPPPSRPARKKGFTMSGTMMPNSLRLLRNEAARDPIRGHSQAPGSPLRPVAGSPSLLCSRPIDDARYGHRRNAPPCVRLHANVVAIPFPC